MLALFPRCHTGRVPSSANTAVYCSHDSKLSTLRSLERLQGRHSGFKENLSVCHRRRALQALDQLSQRWDNKYPQISRSWRTHWENINTLFKYPHDIRKAIYTTNAIESLNSVIRKVIKKRKLFPTDDSAKKVVFLAVQDASKKWTMPIRHWKLALNRFMIEFEDRLSDFV